MTEYSYPCSSRRRKLMPSDIIIGWCVPFTTPISVTHYALRVTTLFAVSYLLPLVAPIMYLRKPALGNPERAS